MLFTRRPSVPLRSPSAPWLLLGAPRNVLATVLAKRKAEIVENCDEELVKSSVQLYLELES